MWVSAKMLREKDACSSEVRIFQKEWPEGAKITFKNVLRALDLNLDIDWLADHCLTAPALKVYVKIDTPAFEAYVEACDRKTTTAADLRAYKKAAATALVKAANLNSGKKK